MSLFTSQLLNFTDLKNDEISFYGATVTRGCIKSDYVSICDHFLYTGENNKNQNIHLFSFPKYKMNNEFDAGVNK